ncbi:MAG: hypothetical protein AB7F91_02490 [Parvularculaceae bacterium]
MKQVIRFVLLVLTIVWAAPPAEAAHYADRRVSTQNDLVTPAENRSYGYDNNGRLLTSTGPWGNGGAQA